MQEPSKKPLLQSTPATVVLVSLMLFAICTVLHLAYEAYTALPYRKVLSERLEETALRARLNELSVVQVKLTCTSSQKLEGIFQFESLEGREDLTVPGDTRCTKSGRMLELFASGNVYARDNYTVELVTKEVLALIAKAQLKPNPGNRENAALAEELREEFDKLARIRAVPAVAFKCDEAGQPYEYAAAAPRGLFSRTRGQLTTTCELAHQNFWVGVAGLAGDELAFKLHEYNAVPPHVVKAAYREFLNEGKEATSF